MVCIWVGGKLVAVTKKARDNNIETNTTRRVSNTKSKAVTKKTSSTSKARKKRKSTSTSLHPLKKNKKEVESTKKTGGLRKEAILFISFAFALFLFISNFGFGGVTGSYLKNVQLGLFGFLGYLFPIIYFLLTARNILYSTQRKKPKNLVTWLLFSSICGFFHLVSGVKYVDFRSLADFFNSQSFGGVLGGIIGSLLSSIIGRIGSFLFLVVFSIICALTLSEKSFLSLIGGDTGKRIEKAINKIRSNLKAAFIDDNDDSFDDSNDYNDFSSEEVEDPISYFEDEDDEDYFGYKDEGRRREFLVRENPRKVNMDIIKERRTRKVTGIDFASIDLKPLSGSENVVVEEEKEEEKDLNFSKPFFKRNSTVQVPEETKKEVEINNDEQNVSTVSEKDYTNEYRTPADSVRIHKTDVFSGSIVKPHDYDASKPFGDEDSEFDEETLRRVQEILVRRGDVILNKKEDSEIDDEVPFEEDNVIEPQVIDNELTSKGLKLVNDFEDEAEFDEEDYSNFYDEYLEERKIREQELRNRHLQEIKNQELEDNKNIDFRNKKSEHTRNIINEYHDLEYEEQPIGDLEEIIESNDFESNDLGYSKEYLNDYSIPNEPKPRENRIRNEKTHNVKQEFKQKEEKPEKNLNENKLSTGIIPYEFPPVGLLKKNPKKVSVSDEEHRKVAIRLQQTLHNFGVEVTVTNVSCGPVVTRYELTPDQGVKVSKIVALADDIKLSLAARDIRIEAPIPGKSAVGIEVPNKESNIVYFRELLETEEFNNNRNKLVFAMGKDIAGKPVITDIAKMPHLLIAGATGSGKSVCINTIIMSILYKYSPNDVKLIMVDPKVVELSVYGGIPHLLIPVVTEAKKAAAALNWAVAEMTDRYKKFASQNVRDLKGYNAKIEKAAAGGEVEGLPEKLPQIVIIIDELADLMMIVQNEVETAISRLAQLARACGIHLVIATQRPSVNVITGLIKANIPTRIAFAVSSGIDSRTILDCVGAEKLLGKGDMLYSPQGSTKPIRIQGAFISDEEVQEVVDYISNQGFGIEFDNSAVESIENTTNNPHSSINDERDELFVSVARLVVKNKTASKGFLQRDFKIGFIRAARIMDQLYEAGIVGADQGTKPREVLMNEEELESYLKQ